MTPHFLLEEIGAPFQLRLVERARNEQKSAAYKKLNPRGLIPVLVDGDTVHPDTLIYFHPQRYTREATGDVSVDTIKNAVEERLTEMFHFIDEQLAGGGPFLMGEQVSLADHY